jgi:hypothetical protein
VAGAFHEAWKNEVYEKGDRLILGDALDRAILEATLAIGERWPEEESAASTTGPAH